MRFREFRIDLDRVLKFNGSFAVLAVLKIGFTSSEVLLLYNVGVPGTAREDRGRQQYGDAKMGAYSDVHCALAKWNRPRWWQESYTFGLKQSSALSPALVGTHDTPVSNCTE